MFSRTSVNPKVVTDLVSDGKVPVISPIAVSEDGSHGFNVNSDLAAAAIAGALDAKSLIIMTDVAGIYRNWPDEGSLIQSIKVDELAEISKGFEGGMIPKTEAAINAIKAGAKKVQVFDGRDVVNVELALKGEGGTLVLP